MSSSSCPNVSQLIAFVTGESVSDLNWLAEHVETCQNCQQSLTHLEAFVEPAVVASLQTNSVLLGDSILSEAELAEAQDHLKKLQLQANSIAARTEKSPKSQMRLDDFRIVKKLGRGGMGVVYLVERVSDKQKLALKTLLLQAGDSARSVARFHREANTIGHLNHPGIPKIHQAWQEAGNCFIAMDFVDGVTLLNLIEHLARLETLPSTFDQLLIGCKFTRQISSTVLFDLKSTDDSKDSRVFELESSEKIGRDITFAARQYICDVQYIREVCQIIVQAALALEHAHNHEIVHRDVKPSNIMVNEAGVYVIDFGLSRLTKDVTLTFAGQVIGTPRYMSPEQVTHAVKVDRRTDVYSLGLTLYELLTLTPPIQASSYEGLLRTVMAKPLVPVSWLNPMVNSSGLESIVHKASAKNPDDRYDSAIDFATDLECWLKGKSIRAEHYRYRFSDHEIVASRPLSVGLAAIWLFYVAIFYGIVLVPLELGTVLRSNYSLLAVGLVLIRFLLPAILSSMAGWYLLRGRRWARCLTAATATFTLLECSFYFSSLIKVVQAMGDWSVLLRFGQLLMGRVPVTLGSIFVLHVLFFNSKASRWFHQSLEALKEYKSLQKKNSLRVKDAEAVQELSH